MRLLLACSLAALLSVGQAAESASDDLMEKMSAGPGHQVLPDYFNAAWLPREALGDPEGQWGAAGACNQSLFNGCLISYYQALGIAHPPTNAQGLINDISGIIAQNGRVGLQRVCTSDATLYQCLGASQLAACVNPLSLIANGDSAVDAYTLASFRATLSFQCGGGLMPILYNFDCIGAQTMKNNATLQQCRATYSRQVKQDPAHACGYLQTFANCYANQYAACSPAAQWTTCESVRVGGAAVNLFSCSASCTVGKYSEVDEASVADGEEKPLEMVGEKAEDAGRYAHFASGVKAVIQNDQNNP